jgi:hypothetical protein
VKHSEFNPNKDQRTKFTNLGFPNQKNVEPRYQQITLDPEERNNKLQQILSPNEDAEFGFIKTPGFIWVNLTKE